MQKVIHDVKKSPLFVLVSKMLSIHFNVQLTNGNPASYFWIFWMLNKERIGYCTKMGQVTPLS